jgi:hypothetical protein
MTAPTRYQYTPQDAVLAAGTQTQFKLKGGDAFTPLPGTLAIGQVGEKAPLADQTTLEDTAKRSIAGLYDGPEKELKFQSYPTDEGQQAFIAAARANKIVVIQHIWPDNATAEYEVVLLGYLRNETQGDKTIDFVVPCKQNGKTTWGKLGAVSNG